MIPRSIFPSFSHTKISQVFNQIKDLNEDPKKNKNLEDFAEMSRKTMTDKSMQKVMKDYHELVDHGRREIYMVE